MRTKPLVQIVTSLHWSHFPGVVVDVAHTYMQKGRLEARHSMSFAKALLTTGSRCFRVSSFHDQRLTRGWLSTLGVKDQKCFRLQGTVCKRWRFIINNDLRKEREVEFIFPIRINPGVHVLHQHPSLTAPSTFDSAFLGSPKGFVELLPCLPP